MARPADIRIGAVEAKTMVDAGKALILDVVAPHVWPGMKQAVRGAIRIDPGEITRRYGELPQERAIVAYCT